MLLHVLGHVEGQKRILGVEQELGQRLGKLGLAHTRGAQEDERTRGALRILQARAGAADGLGKRGDGLVLADDALVQHAFHAQQLLSLGLGEVADGHAGGHGHHVGDVLNRDVLHRLRGVLFPLLLGLFALLLQSLFLVAQLGGALEVLVADGAVLLGAALPQLLVQIAQLLGQRHVADAHAGAGLVHDVDGLVGQVAILDVAVRERHGSLQRLVGEVHAMVRLVLVAQALHDAHGLLLVGLVDGERLEAALERGVLLQVLAELFQRGGADDLDLAAGQRGLQNGRRVDGALGGAGADDGVDLVDEQQHIAGVHDLLDDLLQALLELAAVLRAGHERGDVQRDEALVAQDVGHLVAHDELG